MLFTDLIGRADGGLFVCGLGADEALVGFELDMAKYRLVSVALSALVR
jgi:hypothetical protein